VADNPRIEELRRRVQKDPASIAFAPLAEDYRRAGRYEEAIETCEAGLERHPGYLSAHVTLGRSLIEVGQLDRAHDELSGVLRAAPENLAALRGLAEIHHRKGDLAKALDYYRAALEFARHDPDLEQVVAEISRELEPKRPQAPVEDGLTFEQVRDELFPELAAGASESASSEMARPGTADRRPPGPPAGQVAMGPATSASSTSGLEPLVPVVGQEKEPGGGGLVTPPSASGSATAGPSATRPGDPAIGLAQIAELERWLDALGPEPLPGPIPGRRQSS